VRKSLEKTLDIVLEVVKTDSGREALGTLASVMVKTFFGKPCPHPWDKLTWLNKNEAVCGLCGRKVHRP
jgi:hypothetical protein